MTRKHPNLYIAIGGLALTLIVAISEASNREGKPWPVRHGEIFSRALATDPRLSPGYGNPRVTLFVQDGSPPAVLGDVSMQIGARLKVNGLKDTPVSVAAADSPVLEVMNSLCEDLDCRWKLETYLVVWPAGERTPEWSAAPLQACSPSIP